MIHHDEAHCGSAKNSNANAADRLPGHRLKTLLVFQATSKLTGGMRVKVDRISRVNWLEVCCPRLDRVLTDPAASIPPASTMNHGAGKQILPKAMSGRLPPTLVNRFQQGFSVPLLGNSPENGGRGLLTWLNRGCSRALPGLAFWFRGPLPSFVRTRYHSMRDLLTLELWFRDGESATAARMSEAAGCPN